MKVLYVPAWVMLTVLRLHRQYFIHRRTTQDSNRLSSNPASPASS
jgi:hypothetical protein